MRYRPRASGGGVCYASNIMRSWHDWVIGIAIAGLFVLGVFSLFAPQIAELIQDTEELPELPAPLPGPGQAL